MTVGRFVVALRTPLQPLWEGRPARALALFRLCVGGLIAVHFAEHFLHTADLLGGGGLYDRSRQVAVEVRSVEWLTRLSPESLRLVFATAAAGACLVSVGVYPRLLSIALLFLAVSVQRALLPIGHLDDFLVPMTLSWLLLLPAQRPLWRPAPEREGAAVAVVLASLLLIYVLLGSWLLEAGSPYGIRSRLPLLACHLVPALFFAPGRGFRALGAALQVALGGYMIATSTLLVSHGILLASALLIWTRERGWHDRAAGAPGVTAPTTIAFAYVVLLVAHQLGGVLPMASRAAITQALFDVGLLPQGVTTTLSAEVLSLSVHQESPSPVSRALEHVRGQLLLRQLAPAAAPAQPSPSRTDLARHFFRRYCDGENEGQTVLAVVSAGGVPQAEWAVQCVGGRALPEATLVATALPEMDAT